MDFWKISRLLRLDFLFKIAVSAFRIFLSFSVGLYSYRPASFNATAPAYEDFELIAPGAENVWICEVGSAELNGSWVDFYTGLTNSTVRKNF